MTIYCCVVLALVAPASSHANDAEVKGMAEAKCVRCQATFLPARKRGPAPANCPACVVAHRNEKAKLAATPRVPRKCGGCGVTYDGTPASVYCLACRRAGKRKIQARPKAACNACSNSFSRAQTAQNCLLT